MTDSSRQSLWRIDTPAVTGAVVKGNDSEFYLVERERLRTQSLDWVSRHQVIRG